MCLHQPRASQKEKVAPHAPGKCVRNRDLLGANRDSRYLGCLAMRFHPYDTAICAQVKWQSSPKKESPAACWWPGKPGEQHPATETQQSCRGSIPQKDLSLQTESTFNLSEAGGLWAN